MHILIFEEFARILAYSVLAYAYARTSVVTSRCVCGREATVRTGSVVIVVIVVIASSVGGKAFVVAAPRIWNSFPVAVINFRS